MKKLLWFLFAATIFSGCQKDEVSPPPVPTTPNPTTPTNPPLPLKLALVHSNYIPGNIEKNIKDSFLLHFNKPVQVKYIKFKESYCLPDIRFTLADSGKTVTFYNFLCGRLGGEYSFEYSVSDTASQNLVDSVRFFCYSRKIPTPGTPSHFFITPDNNVAWVVTKSPNQILCLGITDSFYRRSYNLDFLPSKVVYNSYNNRLYILAASDDYANRSKIAVMNPSDGVIEKTITVYPDQLNHPQHQVLWPYDIAFGSNGYGVLLVQNDNYTPRWKIIDSRLNDSIYIHPSFPTGGNGNFRFASFKSVYPNFDKTKLITLESHGSCRLGIFDCSSESLTELEHPLSSQFYSNFIVINKVKNDVFFGNVPNGQFLLSNGNLVGTVTFFDGLFEAQADFTYRKDETNYMYYLNASLFGIVNYTTGDILMTINLLSDLHNIASTTDGRFVLAIGKNSVTLFDSNMFYSHL